MDKPTRKRARLQDYNYSTPGYYFVTICSKERKQIFGKIVGCGDFDAPRIVLSDYGFVLDKYIKLMNNKYSHMKVDKYVIMPNHFHMIIYVTQKT